MSNGLPGVPIGTIVAFAGLMDPEWLKRQGWLYCDGSSLVKTEYPTLAFAIGNNYGGGRTNFNLPDLRGRFVRGTDLNAKHDPGAAQRAASNPGGLSGDNPGSQQPWLTAVPAQPFKAAEAGDHTHPVPHAPDDNNAYAIAGSHYGLWTNSWTTTSTAGAHTHTIATGGDAETRPINKYVFFIIKFADPS